MKTKILLSVGILSLIFSGNVISKEDPEKNPILNQGTISITCSPELSELTSKWVNEYSSLNPEVKITVNNVNSGVVENLTFISNKSEASNFNEANWKMTVGRDVIVPVMNSDNPFLAEIMKKGISQKQLTLILSNQDKQNWGTLFSNEKQPLHIYIANDEAIKSGVVRFLKLNEIPLNGASIASKEEVLTAIQKDPYAIGFCKLVNVLDTDNQSMIKNIRLLPIDKNGNGTIDYVENIYDNVNNFMRGVWIGKYPRALYSTIYAAKKNRPTNSAELAFLSWVVTDGQQYVNSEGYCDLAKSESQSQLAKINAFLISVPTSVPTFSLTKLVLTLLGGLILLAFIISTLFKRNNSKKTTIARTENTPLTSFGENSVMVPQGLYYDKTHTWAFMERDGTVTIGIDDFLQHITGSITRVEMKSPGDKIKKGELFLSIIQSGKQLSLYAPVSGTIKKQNKALKTWSSYINYAPYGEGWVYRIEPTNWFKEIQFLDIAVKYQKWLDSEFSRVKDFLSVALNPDKLQIAPVILQDGGLLKDGVLAEFGPEVWEDFQTEFLDVYK